MEFVLKGEFLLVQYSLANTEKASKGYCNGTLTQAVDSLRGTFQILSPTKLNGQPRIPRLLTVLLWILYHCLNRK